MVGIFLAWIAVFLLHSTAIWLVYRATSWLFSVAVTITIASATSESKFFHEQSVITLQPPQKLFEDAFFGYSVTYVPSSKRLIVSAPNADNVGKIFQCDVTRKNCSELPTLLTEEISLGKISRLWNGATVEAGKSFFVSCAPRLIKNITGATLMGATSKCFTYDDEARPKTMHKIRPYDLTLGFQKYAEEADPFGWSISIAENNSVLIGAPAINSGRVALYNDPYQDDFPVMDVGHFRTAKFNFGYAVLLKKIKNQLKYLVSSPYGSHGKGMIVIRNNLHIPKTYKNTKRTILSDTSGVGYIFGGSMCLLRHKDNEYLLVGSPAYAPMNSRKFDLGKVDVYANYDMVKPKLIATISGVAVGGHFGHAINNIGDINGDEIDDVAISAPYEDNYRGTIYIFSGATLLMPRGRNTWLQKIKKESHRFFGLSMTVLNNFSGNGCSALGVGSPGSNSALVVQCFASVIINVYIPSTNVKLKKSNNGTRFTFDSCVKVKYPAEPLNITLDMEFEVTAVHPQVTLDTREDSWRYNLSFTEKKTIYCTEIMLTASRGTDLGIPVETKITASHTNIPTLLQQYDPSRVVLSDISVLTSNDKLWIVNCNKSECTPNLQLSLNTSLRDQYIIGKSKEETIFISVKNIGDPAYKSCVYVHVAGIQVKRAQDCERTGLSETWRCPSKGPVWTDDVWKIKSIILEIESITSADKVVEIKAFVSEHCEESSSKNITAMKFALKSDIEGVVIKGTSSINDVVNVTKSYGKHVEHTYLIINNGSTNWVDLQYELELPRMQFITMDTDVKDLILVDESTACSLNENFNTRVTVTCWIRSLKKQKTTKIIALIDTSSLPLEKTRKTTFSTKLILNLDDTIKTESLSNTVVYVGIAIYVILYAVLFSVIMLGVIAYVLYKTGFLKRKNKKKLIKLQKHVRRQTMLRQSLAASIKDENSDEEQILKEIEFIEELSRNSNNQ